jgi:hypothetical protein
MVRATFDASAGVRWAAVVDNPSWCRTYTIGTPSKGLWYGKKLTEPDAAPFVALKACVRASGF